LSEVINCCRAYGSRAQLYAYVRHHCVQCSFWYEKNAVGSVSSALMNIKQYGYTEIKM